MSGFNWSAIDWISLLALSLLVLVVAHHQASSSWSVQITWECPGLTALYYSVSLRRHREKPRGHNGSETRYERSRVGFKRAQTHQEDGPPRLRAVARHFGCVSDGGSEGMLGGFHPLSY